jgi:hypothetical protein
MPTKASGTGKSGEEFGDLTQDVIDGAGRIQQALKNVITTAGEADDAHNKLSDAHKKAGDIAKDYAEALSEAEGKLEGLSRSASSLNIGSGLGTACKETAGLATNLSNVNKATGSAVSGIGDFGTASSAAATMVADLRSEIDLMADAMSGANGGNITVDVANAKKSLSEIQDAIDQLQAVKVNIDIDTSGIDVTAINNLANNSSNVQLKIDVDIDAAISQYDMLARQAKSVGDSIAAEDFEIKLVEANILKQYVAGMTEAEKATKSMLDAEIELINQTSAMGDAYREAGKIVKANNAFDGQIENINDAIAANNKYIKEVKKGAKALNKTEFINKEIETAQLEKLKTLMVEIKDPAEKLMVAQMGVGEALEYVSKNVKGAKEGLEDAAEAAAELAKTSSTLNGEMRLQGDALDLLRGKYNEGAKEADNFGGGIAKTGGLMIGAGVAAFFLLKKLGDLSEQFKDAAVGLSKFNVDLVSLEKGISGIKYGGQLADIRDDAGLTRDQFGAFVEVLKDGANSGVTSLTQLAEANEKLKAAFGGDQTERLKEYVELLQLIPTIETDLAITASVDDRAAAVFALQEEGKISSVLELQSAGLLGGIEVSSSKDVDLLNASQRTEKLTQDIKDAALSYFPTWGPELGAIASHTFAALGLLSGAIAAVGTVATMVGVQVGAQGVTTAAVLGTGAKGAFGKGFSRGGGGLKGALRGAKGAVKATAFGPATGALGKGAKMAAKGLLNVGKFGAKLATVGKSIAAPWTLVALAATVAGNALTKVKDDVSKGSSDVAASTKRLSGEALKAAGTIGSLAATGAAVGAVFFGVGAPVGAAIGAIVGAGVVMTTSTGAIGKAMQDFGGDLQATGKDLNGVEFNKFVGPVRAYGKAVAEAGSFLSDMDTVARDYIKTNNITLKGMAKTAFMYGTLPGQLWTAGKAAVGLAAALSRTAEQQASLDALAASSEVTAGMIDKLAIRSDVLSKTLGRNIERQGKSAVAYDMSIKSLNAATNSAKFALVKFQQELGEADVKALSEIGGSAGQFDKAIAGLSMSVTNRFGDMTKALEGEREKIMKNGDLQASERKNALDKLYQQELAAVNELVSGMETVVASLLEAPEILKSGLQEQIRGDVSSLQTEGTTGVGDIGATFSAQIDPALANFKATIEASNKVIDEGAKMQSSLSDKRTAQEASLLKIIEGASAGVKESLGDSVKVEEVQVDGKPIKKLNIDMKELAKTSAVLDEKIKKAVTDLNASAKKIENVVAVKAGKQFAEAAKDVAQLNGELEDAQQELAKAQGKVKSASKGNYEKEEKKATEAAERVAKFQAKKEEAATKAANLSDSIKKQIDNATKGIKDEVTRKKAQEALYARLTKGTEGTLEEQALIQDGLKRLGVHTEEQRKAAVDVAKKIKEVSELTDVSSIQKALLQNMDGQNAALTSYAEAVGKSVSSANQLRDAVSQLADIQSKEAAASQRLLEMREASLPLAQMNGDALGAVAGIQDSQNKVFEDQLKSSKVTIKLAKEKEKAIRDELMSSTARLKAEKDNLAALTKANASAQDVATATKRVQIATVGVNGIQQALNEVESGITAQQQMASSAAEGLLDISGKIDDALSAFEGTTSGRRIAAELDLSEALNDAAEFSDDFAKLTAASFSIGKKAAAEELAAKVASIKNAAKIQKQSIKRQVQNKTITADAGAERERTLQSKTQAELARAETAEKRKVLDLASKEADIANKSLDLNQRVIDAELDYLSTVGGNLDSFVKLQNQSVSIERQRLAVMQKEYDKAEAAGAKGNELREREVKLIEQGFKLKKAEFGVQKDIFDKIIGAAFGQIRSSIGASRQRFSDVALGGIENTRVKTKSGLLTGAGPGGVKTIDERRNERMLAGVGGERGAAATGVGGVVGDSPGKSVEEKLFAETQASAKANKEVAEAGVPFFVAGTKKGSIYTHDEGMQTRLDALIGLQKSSDDSLGEIAGEAGSSESGPSEGESEIVGAVKEQVKATDRVAKLQDGMKREIASTDDKMKQSIDSAEANSEKGFSISTASNMELVTQLKLSRVEAKRSFMKIGGTGLKGDDADVALAETGKKLQQVVNIEKEIKNRAVSNPVAGSEPQIRDIGRILSGKLPASVKEFKKLTAAREQIKQEERTGREKETTEKTRTQQVARTSIASGKTEGGVMERFGTKREGPQEQAKAVAKGISMASNLSLTSGTGSSAGTSSGFGSFGGQSAKEIAAASKQGGVAMALSDTTASGNPAFLGGTVGTAAAQLSSGGGLTGKMDEFGRAETQAMALERLRGEMTESNQTDDYVTGADEGSGLALQTKYGKMQTLETRWELEKDKMNEADEQSERDAILARSTAKDTMAGVSTLSPTKTGAESLEESDSVTGVKEAKEENALPGVIGAKEEASQQLAPGSQNQPSAAELGAQQQGRGAFDDNPAFQQKSEFSNQGSGTGNSTAPTMKVEGTMKVDFNNTIFKSTIASVVGVAMLSAENIDALAKDLQSKGFLNKNG